MVSADFFVFGERRVSSRGEYEKENAGDAMKAAAEKKGIARMHAKK